jgi:hypothetical protein
MSCPSHSLLLFLLLRILTDIPVFTRLKNVPMDNVLYSILNRSSGCVQFGCIKLHNVRQLTCSECTKHSMISWHSRTQRAVLQRSAATVFSVRTSYPRAHKLARRLTLTIQFPSSTHSSNTAIREVSKPCKYRLPVEYCASV